MKETLSASMAGVEWIPRTVQWGRWLVAAALAACTIRSAAAQQYEQYPPPQPLPAWSEQSAPIPNDPQALSSDTPVDASAPGSPGLLRARFESGETQSPPGGDSAGTTTAAEAARRPLRLSRESASSRIPDRGPTGGQDAILNAGASLGIVLALFLTVAWAVRRGAPKGYAPLPSEAVEVLGRATLVGRAQVHLVRCGNKIVLVHASAAGVQTLTEITDPAEVDRLHSICHPGGSSDRGWRRWLRQSAAPRPVDYLTRDDGRQLDFRNLEMGGRSG